MFYNKFVLKDGTVLYDNIVSVSYSQTVNSDNDNISPGAVCACSVDIEFWVNDDHPLALSQGTQLTYYKINDDTAEEIKMGIFFCEKPEKSGANKYKVTAYDGISKLDVDVSEWLNGLTFPTTIKDFASSLSAELGMMFTNNPPINGSFQVQQFIVQNVTARDLMKMVAQATGTFIYAPRSQDDGTALAYGWYVPNSKLGIAPSKSLGESSGTTTTYNFPMNDSTGVGLNDSQKVRLCTADVGTSGVSKTTAYFLDQLTFSDFTVSKIDKVQVKQSDDDVGVIYPPDATGTNAMIIQGNKLLIADSEDALQPAVQALYNRFKDIQYVPCSGVQVPETVAIKAGDIVTINDGKREFQSYITSFKSSGGRSTLESVGSAVRNTTTAVNNKNYSTKAKMLEISTTIDGLNVKATQISQDVEGLHTQYTELKQTFDKFEVTAVTDGNVRSKFALDPTSVTIQSGTITFAGDTLVVDSTNFKLAQDGTVNITGTLTSKTTYSEAVIGDGEITLSQMVSDGSYSPAVKIYSDGVSGSYLLGHIRIYGNEGDNDNRIDLYNDSAGSHFEMYTGGTHTKFFDVRADSNGEGHVSIGGVNALGYLECKRLKVDGHNVALARVNYTNQEGTATWEYLLTAHQGNAW